MRRFHMLSVGHPVHEFVPGVAVELCVGPTVGVAEGVAGLLGEAVGVEVRVSAGAVGVHVIAERAQHGLPCADDGAALEPVLPAVRYSQNATSSVRAHTLISHASMALPRAIIDHPAFSIAPRPGVQA